MLFDLDPVMLFVSEHKRDHEDRQSKVSPAQEELGLVDEGLAPRRRVQILVSEVQRVQRVVQRRRHEDAQLDSDGLRERGVVSVFLFDQRQSPAVDGDVLQGAEQDDDREHQRDGAVAFAVDQLSTIAKKLHINQKNIL